MSHLQFESVFNLENFSLNTYVSPAFDVQKVPPPPPPELVDDKLEYEVESVTI